MVQRNDCEGLFASAASMHNEKALEGDCLRCKLWRLGAPRGKLQPRV